MNFNALHQGFGEPVVLGPSESSGSRFGTSLADLGDINYDGYNGR